MEATRGVAIGRVPSGVNPDPEWDPAELAAELIDILNIVDEANCSLPAKRDWRMDFLGQSSYLGKKNNLLI